MLKFILFVLAGAVIYVLFSYVLFSYVLRLFNLSDDLIIGITSVCVSCIQGYIGYLIYIRPDKTKIQ